MEEEQFDEIISSLGMIEVNTAWNTAAYNELEQADQRLHNLEMVMLDNNKLLKKLLDLLEKKNKD